MAFRYIAVHHPLNYSQTSNDCAALKGRMIRYLGPVVVLSLLFNVTKFMEATYKYGRCTYNINTVALATNLLVGNNNTIAKCIVVVYCTVYCSISTC